MRNVTTMLICSMLLSAAVGMADDTAGQGGDKVVAHEGHNAKKAPAAKKKDEPKKDEHKKDEHNKDHNKEHKK